MRSSILSPRYPNELPINNKYNHQVNFKFLSLKIKFELAEKPHSLKNYYIQYKLAF